MESETGDLLVEEIADSIGVPFGMDFLPGQKLIVTNRPTGEVFIINIETGIKNRVKNIPSSLSRADGGALDILVHPDYDKNGWIYFSHSIGDTMRSTMVVDRFKLANDSVYNRQRIFTTIPYYKEPNHYGSRMAIKDSYLYFTMGDRYYLRDSAQSLSNHLGKVLRIHDDGRIPTDNPYVDSIWARPEIWSLGHRNPQGLTIHPKTGELWEHEHGPLGGDEVNLISRTQNYGWPVICHGIDYDGTPIGEGLIHKDGMQPPVHYYTPSIAPSGMTFYLNEDHPDWNGNLFIGGMALRHLNRLVLDHGKVLHEERMLQDLNARVRNVKQGPDGYLYIAIDGGKILRITPR
jgi:glucose/arabinose dehydrogenase